MQTQEETERALRLYADTVRRICAVHLPNPADTEDAFQNVFIKYMQSSKVFTDSEHEKAWFIRVTVNACHDMARSFLRKKVVSLEEIRDIAAPASIPGDSGLLSALRTLPEKYRNVLYLYYYEGYQAEEIGKMTGKKVNTIYTQLARAKKMLKDAMGGGGNAE